MTDSCDRRDCPGYGSAEFDEFGYCTAGLHERGSGAASDPEVELIDPVPPEHSRRCPKNHPLQQGDGRPVPLRGVCGCGESYDFTRTLAPDEVVDGAYRVRGCIARGGVGGIYLAQDLRLEDPVILKGLLNPNSEDGRAIVEAERRSLVAVKHPNIVGIRNAVKHRFDDGSEFDFLVMEYAPGQPLSDKNHRLRYGPGADFPGAFPPEDAIPFILQVLEAFAYLHEIGQAYCDLKPDNLIEDERAITVVDLGAARPFGPGGEGTDRGHVYGTPGYSAPEVQVGGDPDAVSDLYTVGRTLAVLTLAFKPAAPSGQGFYSVPLPPRPPKFNEALHLFLERACADDRSKRFATAADMADQLRAVLRLVRAERDLDPGPAASTRFGPERGALASALADRTDTVFTEVRAEDARSTLPVPLADRADPAFADLEQMWLLPPSLARDLVENAEREKGRTTETRLTRLRLAIELGRGDVPELLSEAEGALGADWRLDWYRGVRLLSRDTAAATHQFRAVRRHLPGEPAPMLALAICEELAARSGTAAGEHLRRAAVLYKQVWQADKNHPSAAFGVARCSKIPDDRTRALRSVPTSSIHYHAAQQALIAGRLRRGPDKDALRRASARFDNLRGLDRAQFDLIEAELWHAALAVIARDGESPDLELQGVRLTRNEIGHAYEAVLHRLASNSASARARRALVREANRHRARSWL